METSMIAHSSTLCGCVACLLVPLQCFSSFDQSLCGCHGLQPNPEWLLHVVCTLGDHMRALDWKLPTCRLCYLGSTCSTLVASWRLRLLLLQEPRNIRSECP